MHILQLVDEEMGCGCFLYCSWSYIYVHIYNISWNFTIGKKKRNFCKKVTNQQETQTNDVYDKILNWCIINHTNDSSCGCKIAQLIHNPSGGNKIGE